MTVEAVADIDVVRLLCTVGDNDGPVAVEFNDEEEDMAELKAPMP